MEEIIRVEEVTTGESMQKMTFPKLETMELFYLVELKWFSSKYPIEFPKLRKLWINLCRVLKTFVTNADSHEGTFFDDKVACPMLDDLYISSLSKMVKIWQKQPAGDSFSKLRSLKMYNCNALKNIFPTNSLGTFQRVEMLSVESCQALETIYHVEGPNGEGLELQLRDLNVRSLPKLKHIWDEDPQGKLRFPNLRSVVVESCRDLKNLFPFSVAKCDLFQLKELNIRYCDLEEIVAEGANGEAAINLHFVFPQLTSLKLISLSKLRSFYGKRVYTWELPMLKKLKAYDCENVNLFGSKLFVDFDQSQGDNSAKSTILMVEKVLPTVEKLTLSERDASSSLIWRCQFPLNFFSNLKILQLERFNDDGISGMIQCGFPQKLSNLEQLKLNNGKGWIEKEDHSRMSFPKLKSLHLSRDLILQHIWGGGNPKLFLISPQTIQSLQVHDCRGMLSLAAAYASLENLTYLDVSVCHNLRFLLTSSTAKSLVQLVELEVTNCRGITEIISVSNEEEDQAVEEIVFTKLEHVRLRQLRHLTCFYPGNRTLKFPALKKLIVDECPEIGIFSHGFISTPKLRGEVYSNAVTKLGWDTNLNATMQKKWEEYHKLFAK